jgi:hypothetical protein
LGKRRKGIDFDTTARLSEEGKSQDRAGRGTGEKDVDEAGNNVERGAPGELVIRGDGVMREYYKNPEATAKALKDGWLFTGDIVREDEDGFIYIVDRKKDVIITTFGDMMRVPGSTSSLQKEKAEGRSIRIVYSPLEALRLAKEHPAKKIVFLAVGFETTSPAIAMTLLQAHREGIKNLFFLNTQKRVPPALRALLESKKVQIHGFILPGHVSTIIGYGAFVPIVKEYRRPCVVAGFEPMQIIEGLAEICQELIDDKLRRNRFIRQLSAKREISQPRKS